MAFQPVAYWAVHGDPDNLESFLDGRREGNFRKITQKYEELLLEVIEKEPEEYGYEFGRWTGARLATYLEEVTGIKLIFRNYFSQAVLDKIDMSLAAGDEVHQDGVPCVYEWDGDRYALTRLRSGSGGSAAFLSLGACENFYRQCYPPNLA